MKIQENWKKNAILSAEDYEDLYNLSIKDNEGFWKDQGNRLDWVKKYSKIKDIKYSSTDVNIKWYYDGELNVSENCIDRHAKNNPNKIAIIWEGDDPNNTLKITYKELLLNVSRTANALKKLGVQKGDRVTIY